MLDSKSGALGDRETHRFPMRATMATQALNFVSFAVRDGDEHVLHFTYTAPTSSPK